MMKNIKLLIISFSLYTIQKNCPGYICVQMVTWDKVVIVNPGWQHGLNMLLLWIDRNTWCKKHSCAHRHPHMHVGTHKHTQTERVSYDSKSLVQAHNFPSLLAAEPYLNWIQQNYTPEVQKIGKDVILPLHWIKSILSPQTYINQSVLFTVSKKWAANAGLTNHLVF